MKFVFIAKHRNISPVAWLCNAMDVSRSGFHARLNRSPSAKSRSDETVGQQVKVSFFASDRTYGARRVWRDVLADGVECGLHRIARHRHRLPSAAASRLTSRGPCYCDFSRGSGPKLGMLQGFQGKQFRRKLGLALLWQIVDFVSFYRIPESIFQ
ncbi:hypothetical protein ABIB75_008224 [Bradyrhizobium sp. GM2.2]